ncbi:MAG: DUF2520 domain-containing protein [Bacteroidales bacterium]|nr:DUF2520 domain-containing protein [Bacteroidales bacterium]
MITLIGSGNVATWIAQRLQGNLRFPITQVFSRHLEHAQTLADLLNAEAIEDIRKLNPDNQIFIFALADKAYDEILPLLPFKLPLAFTTSGTVSCQCLKDYAEQYGVIYPLQTFTKSQDMRKLEVPLCLESDFAGEHKTLMWELARELSPTCYEVSEAQRAKMHVAAVFACNFSNAMYQIAYKLLKENGLPFEILLPVLHQTVEKVAQMTPAEAQTGPAVRGDVNVMRAQISTLSDDRLKELYRLVSELIMEC